MYSEPRGYNAVPHSLCINIPHQHHLFSLTLPFPQLSNYPTYTLSFLHALPLPGVLTTCMGGRKTVSQAPLGNQQ